MMSKSYSQVPELHTLWKYRKASTHACVDKSHACVDAWQKQQQKCSSLAALKGTIDADRPGVLAEITEGTVPRARNESIEMNESRSKTVKK